MRTEDEALEKVLKIIADNDNYQTSALKLGGIWSVCDHFAEYRRSKTIDGLHFVEVKRKCQD